MFMGFTLHFYIIFVVAFDVLGVRGYK